MSISNDYLTYVLEQLAPVGPVTARKMFGGAGIYLNGKMFDLIAEDTFYLKVDNTNRADYEKHGTGPFHPFSNKKMTMPYYEVPAEILEDRQELKAWAQKAIKVPSKKRR
jgi:DNA transformation protein